MPTKLVGGQVMPVMRAGMRTSIISQFWDIGARDIRTSVWRRVRRCLESKRFRYSSGQIIHSHRGVNLNGVQFQTPRFLVEAMSEHGIALEQVAEGPLRVACFPEKSPFRSPPAIDHSLTEFGCRDEPNSVTTHGEERLYEVWQQSEASAITPGFLGRRRISSMIILKPSPWNQWNVSSMAFGDRLTHLSSMSIAMN
jgi:hypothetical protein